MKKTQYITIDVSEVCKFCGYTLDKLTGKCTHCNDADEPKGLDIVAEKALWSEQCFSANFHYDTILRKRKRKELPYVHYGTIKCINRGQYKNLVSVIYEEYNSTLCETIRYSGIIDISTGDVIIPLIYQYIGCIHDTEIVPVELNYKWGAVNLNNDIIIPFKYNRIEDFYRGQAKIEIIEKRDDIPFISKYGIIDCKGALIIPPIYQSIDRYDKENYTYKVSKKLYSNYIYFDKNGNQVLEPGTEHQKVVPINDRYYVLGKSRGSLILAAKKHNDISKGDVLSWGVINTSYQEIVPCIYDEYGIDILNKNCIVIKQNIDQIYRYRIWTHIVDNNGNKFSLPNNCKGVSHIPDINVYVAQVNTLHKVGFTIFKNNKLYYIAKLDYEDMIICGRNYLKFKQNGKWGIISIHTGKIIIPPIYSMIKNCDIENKLYVRIGDNEYGYINIIDNMNPTFISCSQEEWLNTKQYIVAKRICKDALEWDYITDDYTTHIFCKRTKQPIVNIGIGNLSLMTYELNGQIYVRLNQVYKETFGLISPTGNQIVPCIYNKITYEGNNIIRLSSKNESRLIQIDDKYNVTFI